MRISDWSSDVCSSDLFQILIIPPFFEEMNRTRWLLLAAMRTLDEARIGTILPDLPGQNESLAPDESVGLAVWRAALERLAGQSGVSFGMVAAFRSGARQMGRGSCRERVCVDV